MNRGNTVNRMLKVLTLLAVLGPGPVAAGEVGSGTVQDFRRWSQQSSAYSVGYAVGAMTAVNPWLACPEKFTVGEFESWLKHTAEPEWTMLQATIKFFSSRQCMLNQDVRQYILRDAGKME